MIEIDTSITIDEAAQVLNNNQYGEEGSKELFSRMKKAGLVAVFGYSDDNIEFRGAIDDEVGAGDGTTIHVTKDGLLVNDCENDRCPHFEKTKKNASKIIANWCPEGSDAAWVITTELPHKTFQIVEDDGPYCIGLVFNLAAA